MCIFLVGNPQQHIFSQGKVCGVKKRVVTWFPRGLLCFGPLPSLREVSRVPSNSARSVDRDLLLIRFRLRGEPGLSRNTWRRLPSRPGSKGLTYTELLIDPLGPMEPWAAKSSMLAKEPWLGKAQVPKNSLESTLPKSPLAFFGPNSLKLFNSIMLLLSVVSMLPPWKLGCETSFLQSWNIVQLGVGQRCEAANQLLPLSQQSYHYFRIWSKEGAAKYFKVSMFVYPKLTSETRDNK